MLCYRHYHVTSMIRIWCHLDCFCLYYIERVNIRDTCPGKSKNTTVLHFVSFTDWKEVFFLWCPQYLPYRVNKSWNHSSLAFLLCNKNLKNANIMFFDRTICSMHGFCRWIEFCTVTLERRWSFVTVLFSKGKSSKA